MYIDLSHTFEATMPVFPGDSPPTLTQLSSVEKDGLVHFEVTTGMHVGTHIDAPAHFIEHGKDLADFPVSTFFGRGIIIDAQHVGPTLNDLPARDHVRIKKGDIVLIHTGWDKKFRFPDYYNNYPVISTSLAKQFAQLGVKMVGFDTPSPDREPYEVHKVLLGHTILIIENLTNLNQLLPHEHFEVIALAPKFDTEASPARVVAKVLK